MLLGRDPVPVEAVRVAWTWTGTRGRDLRSEALLARRNRILGALRAGHGIGAAFVICVESGPPPETLLAGSSIDAVRWIARVLTPAYGRASWTRVVLSAQSSLGESEWGKRVRPWPERLRDASDGLPAISQLLQAMTILPAGIRLRWAFTPSVASWRSPGDPGPDSRPFAPGPMRSGVAPLKTPAEARPRGTSSPVFWHSTAELQFSPAVAGHREGRTRARAAVEGALRSGRANGLRFTRYGRLAFGRRPWFELSEDELLEVLPDAEGFDLSARRGFGATLGMLPLGRSEAGTVVGPAIEAGQGRHVAVLGETGMGKSATLVAIGLTAKEFGGVILLDPLGETAQGFVRGLAPEERRTRLRVVSPSRGSGGINALEGIAQPADDPARSDRRLDDLVHALRRVRFARYESRYWGPRLEEMLTRALAAAAVLPAGTLTDAHALLAADGGGHRVVPPEAREAVRSLGERIHDRPEDAEGARRLLYEVVRSPVLRHMLCERAPRLHAADLVAPGNLAVISGDAAMVGESASRYLLAVHLALLWSELLARPSSPKTFVLLDESQWFAHESLAEMLRLARRRNVHVILATQTVSSLPEEVREAAWTNVSDFVAFRGSPEEARELSRATGSVSPEEILSLPRGHAAVLLGKGNSIAWVRTVGRPSGPEGDVPGMPSDPTAVGSGPHRHDASLEEILAWLRARTRVTPDGLGPIRVSLTELRAELDPDGQAIRAAGALLGRSGALLGSSRDESGSVWTVDPRRIPPAPTGPSAVSARGDAEETQPS